VKTVKPLSTKLCPISSLYLKCSPQPWQIINPAPNGWARIHCIAVSGTYCTTATVANWVEHIKEPSDPISTTWCIINISALRNHTRTVFHMEVNVWMSYSDSNHEILLNLFKQLPEQELIPCHSYILLLSSLPLNTTYSELKSLLD
jgi:hypothetical protein